jgi:hypothetical protein
MEITRIFDPILNALRDKKFVGDFKVTIYHPYMPPAEIKGYKQNESSFPYDFSCDLKNKINEICFLIVSGVIRDGDFYFSIKGQIEYLYECDGVEE